MRALLDRARKGENKSRKQLIEEAVDAYWGPRYGTLSERLDKMTRMTSAMDDRN